MGLILSSLARSLEASSHSFVIVLGGGGAVCQVESYGYIYKVSERERTDGTDTAIYEPGGADKDADASNDFDSGAGWANGGTGPMWPKSNIIR